MSSSSAYHPPCAACKFLRRKCMPWCTFSPYFPPEEPHKFANVHKIFGASNVAKLLNDLLPHQREDAVNSLAYEAEARMRDPIYGCVGAIAFLQRQVDRLQRELDGASALTRMAELRLVCERDIPIQQQRVDSAHNNYRGAFTSAKSEAQHTIQLQEKLGKLKGEMRESEDALVKALSVKTRKEAKRMATLESISVMKARVQELKGLVKDQRERKDQYAAIISQQYEALTACKEKCDQSRVHREQIEEAISWYNKVLDFRVECGHGVKFIFTNISPKNPNEEYSFVIRHANDTYTLLSCNPHLSDIKELVAQLNKSNGLFEFVRTMREKFQEAAARGTYLHSSSPDQASSMNSLSAPVASISTDPGVTSTPEELRSAKSNSNSRKVGKGNTVQSPRSASSVRRSARLKGRN